MVGDQSGKITHNFGVMREGQGLADRATSWVDQKGIIPSKWKSTAEGIVRERRKI